MKFDTIHMVDTEADGSPDDLDKVGGPFDMIFIDGNHYLNYVMRDILGSHKILNTGDEVLRFVWIYAPQLKQHRVDTP